MLGITSTSYLTNELVTRESFLTFQKYIGILPNPSKVISDSGSTSQTYSDLRSDPHVWSCLQSRKTGVLSLNWELSQKNQNLEMLNLIQNALAGLDLFNLFSNILEAIFTGYQVLEILWGEFERGIFLPKEIVSKPIEWFFYDTLNQIKFRASGNLNGIPLPENKFLIPRNNPTYENPYGESLLSKCYWSVTIKNMGFRFWMNFLEKYGMPLIIGQYNYPPTEEELANLSNRLQDLVDSQTIATPSDISIDIKDIGQSKSVELYSQLIKLANSEISKALLSETLTTEMDSGSYAASVTHFKVRQEIILGDVKLVERTIDNLIKYILNVNGFNLNFHNQDFVPKFKLILE